MTLAVCLNAVSFAVANAYAGCISGEHMVVLYDASRISRDNVDLAGRPTITYIPVGRTKYILFAFLSLIGFIDTLLIPHHILGRAGNTLRVFAKNVHYIDDGLDTLRDEPKNFDLDNYSKNSIYYTFLEYEFFGRWLEDKKIERIASVNALLDGRCAFGVAGNTLIVESPGINRDAVAGQKKSYIFRHPNHNKQLNWEGLDVEIIDSSIYSPEQTILEMVEGCVVIGETMTFVICLYLGINKNVSIKVFGDKAENIAVVEKISKKFQNQIK